MEMLREQTGKWSASRGVLWFIAGMLAAAWLGVGGVQLYQGVAEESPNVIELYLPWLDWGHEVLFAAVLPYAVNKLSSWGKGGSGSQ